MVSKMLVRGACAAALLAFALPSVAARVELQAGPSYMDTHATPVVFVEAAFAPRALGTTRFAFAPDVSLGWVRGRHLAKFGTARYTARADVALAAAGLRFTLRDSDRWYRHGFLSEQVAATNRTTQALSSHYQFVTTLGWRGDRTSLAVRHISNGSLHGPNRGETMLLFGVALAP